MDAKSYLMQAGIIKARLQYIDAMIDKLRLDIEQMTDVSIKSAWPDGQPHGTKTTDPTGATASRLADKTNTKRDELRERLVEYEYEQIETRSALWSKQTEILDVIGQVNDPVLFSILVNRYIEGKTFEWIAVNINYSYRHTINLHGKALAEVQKIINKKTKLQNIS